MGTGKKKRRQYPKEKKKMGIEQKDASTQNEK